MRLLQGYRRRVIRWREKTDSVRRAEIGIAARCIGRYSVVVAADVLEGHSVETSAQPYARQGQRVPRRGCAGTVSERSVVETLAGLLALDLPMRFGMKDRRWRCCGTDCAPEIGTAC